MAFQVLLSLVAKMMMGVPNAESSVNPLMVENFVLDGKECLHHTS